MKAWHRVLIGIGFSLTTFVAIVLAATASGAVFAQGEVSTATTGAAVVPEAPQAGMSYYHIPGYVLVPGGPSVIVAHDNFGCIHATAGDELPLYAALDIPPGSRVVSFSVFYYDTSVGDVSGRLDQYSAAGKSAVVLASASSSGTGGYGSSSDDLDHVIDTFGSSYAIRIAFSALSGSLRFCGVRVGYYAPFGVSFVPAVMRGAAAP